MFWNIAFHIICYNHLRKITVPQKWRREKANCMQCNKTEKLISTKERHNLGNNKYQKRVQPVQDSRWSRIQMKISMFLELYLIICWTIYKLCFERHFILFTWVHNIKTHKSNAYLHICSKWNHTVPYRLYSLYYTCTWVKRRVRFVHKDKF